ncbi:MAG: H-NS histone family protein [Thiobacillaceae bacterium]|nr:H-NS histone family protein [Thiobacillaceae bacterium]
MSTYKELQDQIAALQKQAEEARKQEIAAVVNEIKAKMAEFGISVEDLGYAARGRGRKRGASGAYKYRNPATGETWTGKGRKPGWMVKALQEGKTMDSFLA